MLRRRSRPRLRSGTWARLVWRCGAALALIGFALLGLRSFAAQSRSRSAADDINIAEFDPTFSETFSKISISAHGPGTTWTAHTPWGGDFGDAIFDDPGPNGPFSLGPHGLRIKASKDGDGRWHSGLIASVDRDGAGQKGFAQQFGYFEMRARLPAGSGTWPAFWLIGANKSDAASEIDVVEFYGLFPRYFHSVLHLFENGKDILHKDHLSHVPSGELTSDFNDFGVLIETDQTTFYLNRHAIWREPTPKAYAQPFYIMADLAIGGGWPYARLASPAVLDIEYIKVFARKPHPASNLVPADRP